MLFNSGIRASFIYGTAWKKESTAALTSQAIKAGFRAIDTAAQPKHYQEDLVGAGIRDAISAGVVQRKDLHVQTKFTSIAGQDPSNLPYDPSSPLATQVQASVTSSLYNLRPSSAPESANESYIDCFILHFPLRALPDTLEVWTAMSSFVPSRVRSLGISNVNLRVLQAIFEQAEVKPVVVQNRFYAATGYDVALREFCKEKGVVYEGFWTLTGNPKLLRKKVVEEVARTIGVEKEQALYGLVSGLGIVPLNGTTNEGRMKGDLEAAEKMKEWAEQASNAEVWKAWMTQFRGSLQSL